VRFVNREFWGFNRTTNLVSPDGTHIAPKCANRNFEHEMFLYPFGRIKKLMNLTHNWITETEPVLVAGW